MNNIPKIKVGIVAVSRDCFPASLAITRREALVKQKTEQLTAMYNNIVSTLKSVHDQMDIRRQDIESRFNEADAKTKDVPRTERELGDISRQQEVKAGSGQPAGRPRRCLLRHAERQLQPAAPQHKGLHSGVSGRRC